MRKKMDSDTAMSKDANRGSSHEIDQYESANPRFTTNADKPRDKRPMPSTGKIFR